MYIFSKPVCFSVSFKTLQRLTFYLKISVKFENHLLVWLNIYKIRTICEKIPYALILNNGKCVTMIAQHSKTIYLNIINSVYFTIILSSHE